MINSYYEVHVTSHLIIDGKKFNFLDPSTYSRLNQIAPYVPYFDVFSLFIATAWGSNHV